MVELTPAIIKKIDKVWPFKRIPASQEVLDRHNAINAGSEVLEFSVTVKKGETFTDEQMLHAMATTRDLAENTTPLFSSGPISRK